MPTHVTHSSRSLSTSPREISPAERGFFVIIAVAALFVAYLGLAAPESMDRSFTWAVLPPLHAGFVGMLYLFGGVYMIGCIAARRRAQVSAALPAIALFTSLLLFATLLNLEAFDFDLTPVWVWTLSYTIYPVIAVALAWSARGREPGVAIGGPAVAVWARAFLRAQAVAFAIIGLALLIVPSAMVDLWPWPISAGLAQFYGGPFLAYAVCSWQYSGRAAWAELAAIAPSMLVFCAGTVVVSVAHRELFSGSDPAAWVWFAGFGSAAVASLVMSARALPAARARAALDEAPEPAASAAGQTAPAPRP
jgi:hypothetical protein